jgi:hypothetical protein
MGAPPGSTGAGALMGPSRCQPPARSFSAGFPELSAVMALSGQTVPSSSSCRRHPSANESDERVGLTLIFNPAQKREGFFRGLFQILNSEPIDQEAFLALYSKYDSYPVDP